VVPYVDEIKLMAGLGGRSTIVQVPEAAVVLAFRTTVAGRSDVIVVGPRTRGSYHDAVAAPSCVRMRLRPGSARAVLGVPVSELSDRATPLTDLRATAGRRLTERLEAAGDDTGLALTHLASFVSARPAGSGLIAAATRELDAGARLADLAGRLGVGERHLRNLFAREVGLSPKHFARIGRVRRVLSLAGQRRWAAVAEDAGFFDQAHMISDFRAFMGVSPEAYLSGRLPAATPCTRLTGRVH
jgi:AraC-like DNA-binding protein